MNATATSKQPQVDPSTLLGQFEYMDITFDLFGTNDKEGIEVDDVAVEGTTVSLINLFNRKQLADFSHALERRAVLAAEPRSSGRMDAGIAALIARSGRNVQDVIDAY